MKKIRIGILITAISLSYLISFSQTQEKEPCDDKISVELVNLKFKQKLTVHEKRTYQKPAKFHNSYIFTQSFEDEKFSSAFHKKRRVNWRHQKGIAKNGQRMLIFKQSLERLSENTIIADTDNWIILAPFDLSTAKEADFNFYFQLGDPESGQSASFFALISVDGSTFCGYKFSGITCGWKYKNLELAKVPYLGNVCGKSTVWFAFFPSSPPVAPGGKIALDYFRLLVFNPKLAPEVKIPIKRTKRISAKSQVMTDWHSPPSISYHALAEWYSPVIYQDLVCTIYGDYITRINYDGDYIGNNNWDNLGHPHKARPLPAFVYYSVIETETHYFICYALFHPADDFHCHVFSHENDLEGIVVCVFKDGSPYGQLRMVQLQAHHDFYQHKAPGATGIYDRNEDKDGPISLDTTYPGVHPRIYIEGGGHGIRREDTGGAPSAIYYYKGIAQDPDVVGSNNVGYDLLSISAEMWENRKKCCGSGHLLDDWGSYSGWRYSVSNLGRKFDGDDGSDDAASTPWSWSDNDDPNEMKGDWFMDPADYHNWQFRWDENFSTNYIVHPFIGSHLCSDIYNGRGGITTLSYGPYNAVCDVTILQGQTLIINPDVTVKFSGDTKIISYGALESNGNAGAIRFISARNPNIGIKISGLLRLRNGGCIRFQ